MQTIRSVGRGTWAAALGAFIVACGLLVEAQNPLPLLPPRERGNSITPAYEGWFQNADGSYSLLVGYYNRNTQETIEIPVGPNNKIEPGDVDQGQPTFFEIGRQWGVFTIKVPKDFGTKVLTWSITANGEKQSIPLTLNKGYPIAPYKEIGMGNQPPVLWFAEGGTKFTGPPTATAATLTGRVNEPLTLNIWAQDPKPAGGGEGGGGGGGRGGGGADFAGAITLHKFRGPGAVKFASPRLSAKQDNMVTTTATFAAPGAYILRVQANDESGEGGGGFQCCWTNTYLKVTIQ